MHSSLTLDSTPIVRTPAVVMRKGLPAKLALTDADDTRYDFRNLVVSNADGSPRGGVTAPIGTNLVTGTATMNVSVGSFAAVAVRDGGVILLANDGPVNVLIDAAPVSNSRWDLICARQDDASSTVTTPDADNLAKLYVVKGTAGATPAVPALPAGSVEIGRVLVTTGDTNTNAMTVAQTNTYTAGAGGSVPFRSLAALQAWTTARSGQRANIFADPATVKNGDYVWSGGAWNRTQCGGLYHPAAVATFYTITFPAPYSQPPIVTATVQSGASNAIGATILITNVTTSSFQIRLAQDSGTPDVATQLAWIAVPSA